MNSSLETSCVWLLKLTFKKLAAEGGSFSIPIVYLKKNRYDNKNTRTHYMSVQGVEGHTPPAGLA
jgi:hypothetical protein